MGLFDWFRRPRPLPTTTWFSEPSRVRGFCQQVRDDLATGRHVVVVAHFPAGLIEVGEQLATNGIPFTTLGRWQEADTRRLTELPPRVVAVLAKALPQPTTTPPSSSARTASQPAVAVRACELHVLAAENERVRRFAEALPVAAVASAHASLDSIHVAKVLPAAMKSLMAKLGMDGDTPIESPLVDNALRKAMAKLEQQIRGNHAADSLAGWLHRNLQD